MENAIKKIKEHCASQSSCDGCRFSIEDWCMFSEYQPKDWIANLTSAEIVNLRDFKAAGYTHIRYLKNGVELTGNGELFKTLPYDTAVNITSLLGGDTDV